jgi:hypothetical protein
MHGSSFRGDCGRALADLEAAYRDVFGDRKQEATTAA